MAAETRGGETGISLQWWDMWGTYAEALVAAETPERALELLRGAQPEIPDEEWIVGGPAERPVPPAPPPAEGVYGYWAEWG